MVSLLVTTQPQEMNVYYVTATGDCPTENITCHPLSYYTNHTIDWPPNVTLIFLPGEHNTTASFVMSNLSRVIIRSSDRNDSILSTWSRPVIMSPNKNFVKIYLFSIKNLCIQGLQIELNLTFIAISELVLHNVLVQAEVRLGMKPGPISFAMDCNVTISMSQFLGFTQYAKKFFLLIIHTTFYDYLICFPESGVLVFKNVSVIKSPRIGIIIFCASCSEMNLTDIVIDSCHGTGLSVLHPRGHVILTNVIIANGAQVGLNDNTYEGKIILNNVTISNNRGGGMTLFNVNLILNNVTISNNRGGGMTLFNVNLVFYQNPSTIINNYSPGNGGGIKIFTSQYYVIKSDTEVHFINNTAQGKGGAIYYSSIKASEFDLVLPSCSFSGNFKPIFSGNNAFSGGNVVYNGLYWNCSINESFSGNIVVKNNFDSIVNCSNNPTLLNFPKPLPSYITSEALGVCLCSEDKLTINYHVRIVNHQLYPGQIITLSLVTVGACGGISPAVLVTNSEGGIMVSLETINQENEKQCKDFKYKIKQKSSNVNSGKIKLGFEKESELPDNSSLIVDITLLPCPHGLALTNGMCQCNSVISRVNNVKCDVNQMPHPISKSSNSWLYYNTQYDCTVGYVNCPFDYCNSSTISFSLDDSDIQCANNRSGILCGACQQGLSLMLGSNKCGQCSNKYISLILPFIAAGVILVAFLLVSNMTVSVGSINGLLFYANVMKLNESVNGISIPVLNQFIAWLNLDLGIETCFFNGLDGYWKTWLQYCFSFALIALLILCCKLSTKLVHYLGRNVVAVLSTLIFMAHSKLLLAIRNSLMLSVIECEGRKSYVWSVDGNIPYLGHKHIYLFIVSLVVMLSGLLYTITIFSSQWMQKLCGRYCRSSWDPFYRFKSFLDAYTGPYKDRYRYWTGLLLIIRLLLTAVFSYTTETIPIINTYITVFIAGLLIHLLAKEVYCNKILNILELFYMVNLGITALLLALINQASATIITAISVSLSMTAFLITVVVHICIALKKCRYLKLKFTTFFNIQKRETEKEPLLVNSLDDSHINCNDGDPPVVNEREKLIFY